LIKEITEEYDITTVIPMIWTPWWKLENVFCSLRMD
jgi:hypothetical protein